ncbi:DUF3397 domain-containing protein [Virgibacillus xinjiangensis]|uniref:DUF3397 domain-containing protein n=1 Tax=Virgibacillus xinjiangensis TaxID=393090 RepID=A0ABV7CUT0_9BACI
MSKEAVLGRRKDRTMAEYIIYFTAFFIAAPIIASLLVYQVSLAMGTKKRKALHRTVNWTTIFYIAAVGIELSIVFEVQLWGMILSVMLSILAALIFLQWKLTSEIIFSKAWKILWRLSFLLFSFLYVILIFIGIGKFIIH